MGLLGCLERIFPIEVLQGHQLEGKCQHYKLYVCDLDFPLCDSSLNTFMCMLLQ